MSKFKVTHSVFAWIMSDLEPKISEGEECFRNQDDEDRSAMGGILSVMTEVVRSCPSAWPEHLQEQLARIRGQAPLSANGTTMEQ